MSAAGGFETEICIGCTGCTFAKRLQVARAAIVTLAGVNTEGVPLKVTERQRFAVGVTTAGIFGPEVTIQPIEFQNEYTDDLDRRCIPDDCDYADRIEQVDEALRERIGSLTSQ